jgi:8-oxo-dGTP diphosphatase
MQQNKSQAPVRVAVGVILRNGHVCLSLRPNHLHKGGCWEFPGGKINAGETVESALNRELHEELGIQVLSTSSLTEVDWDYPEKSVRLEVLLVSEFGGEPSGMEDQEVRWVPLSELSMYKFPEANQVIIDALQASFPLHVKAEDT